MVYVTVVGQTAEHPDKDWRVERSGEQYRVTDMASGEETCLDLNDFKYEHNSLVKMQGCANLG